MLLVQICFLWTENSTPVTCWLLVGLFYVNLDFSFQSQYDFIDRDVLLQNGRNWWSFLNLIVFFNIFKRKKKLYFWKFQSLQCLPGSWSPPWQLLLQLRKSKLETSPNSKERQHTDSIICWEYLNNSDIFTNITPKRWNSYSYCILPSYCP